MVGTGKALHCPDWLVLFAPLSRRPFRPRSAAVGISIGQGALGQFGIGVAQGVKAKCRVPAGGMWECILAIFSVVAYTAMVGVTHGFP